MTVNSSKFTEDSKVQQRQQCKEFKREMIELLKRYKLVEDKTDHEIKIKITSGNIAWISINRTEIIK